MFSKLDEATQNSGILYNSVSILLIEYFEMNEKTGLPGNFRITIRWQWSYLEKSFWTSFYAGVTNNLLTLHTYIPHFSRK